ncbi:unnamed protein product, partial [Amoebophrya sp. A120]
KGSGAAATVSSKNEARRSSAEQQAAGSASSSSGILNPDVQEKTSSLNATPPPAPAPDNEDRRRPSRVYVPVPNREELDRIVALWEKKGRAASTSEAEMEEAEMEESDMEEAETDEAEREKEEIKREREEVVEKYGPTEYWDVSRIGEQFGGSKEEDVGARRWGPFPKCFQHGMALPWSGVYEDAFKISNWKTTGLTNMRMVFLGCTDFNQPLEWDLNAVIDFSYMFHLAQRFAHPLHHLGMDLRSCAPDVADGGWEIE